MGVTHLLRAEKKAKWGTRMGESESGSDTKQALTTLDFAHAFPQLAKIIFNFVSDGKDFCFASLNGGLLFFTFFSPGFLLAPPFLSDISLLFTPFMERNTSFLRHI